jgi:hypothetical protein
MKNLVQRLTEELIDATKTVQQLQGLLLAYRHILLEEYNGDGVIDTALEQEVSRLDEQARLLGVPILEPFKHS